MFTILMHLYSKHNIHVTFYICFSASGANVVGTTLGLSRRLGTLGELAYLLVCTTCNCMFSCMDRSTVNLYIPTYVHIFLYFL